MRNVNRKCKDYQSAYSPLRPFRCATCNRTYKRQQHLVRHMKYECGVEPMFKCPHCDYRASHNASVKSHVLSRHMKIRHDLWN
ncbi:hypothetical protein GE061_003383 [Apolygus lucorum]|uniref:C2H2-type domain-containing protein n=1 Tax=Apolygus lucorum TaxID=248454 RepID=A0A8S9X204_APOLU|nr:hypothetical protein GE061_003383 [Apolygus lucorum]